MARRPRTLISCKAPGCLTPAVRLGYCEKCYRRCYRHGHPLPRQRNWAKEFWKRVDKSAGPAECWPWGGAMHPDGYGISRTEGGGTSAVHRLAYTYGIGPIPEGLLVDHRCHTPDCDLGKHCPHRRCCNPTHLKAVSAAENSAPDRAVRFRGDRVSACPRGHEYTPENTRRDRNGERHCRECDRTYRNKNKPTPAAE